MAQRNRRSVLDEIKKREIIAILSVGCSRRTAARYVGCAPATITNTAERDDEFAARLRRAENQHEWTNLKHIQQAAKKPQYWRAAAWVLEHAFPEKYARRSPEVITVEQIKRLLAQFAEIIVEEVPVDRFRKNILKRLDDLTRKVCAPSQRIVHHDDM